MAIDQPLEVLIAHDSWATDQLIAACKSLSDLQLDFPFEMGHGSLRATMIHMVDVIGGWHAGLVGTNDYRPLDPKASVAQIAEKQALVAKAFGDYCRAGSPADIVHATKGTRAITAPKGVLVTHILTHGTHHRAQALNMLRHLGIKAIAAERRDAVGRRHWGCTTENCRRTKIMNQTQTTKSADRSYTLPPLGDNPSTERQGTTPGSFANKGKVGTPWTFSSPDTPGMPGVSDKTAWDFLPDRWGTDIEEAGVVADVSPDIGYRHVRILQADGTVRGVFFPKQFIPITQLEHARLGVITPEMYRVATREPHLTVAQVRDEVAAGRMVIPANRNHLKFNLDPMAIGRASLTKINANMGASPVSSGTDEEVEKLKWAEKWGADTVMDLSTGGDLDACRDAIIKNSTVPIGTVPIYSMIIGRTIEELDERLVLETLEHQAKQGVDYFTIHAGVLKEHLPFVRRRLIGIVSRGGSLLAKWMLTHNRQNLMYSMWEQICDVMREHDVTFSIGDGLRPGGLADASDQAQLAELATIGKLTERAWRKGVQVMVEGPGHVPFDQIEYNMKLQRQLCHGAPFYVLGPLVTDIFPGYDHITSCIGATSAGYHGASMLCYVTPKEHLGLPKKDDVKQGCVAYKIAAHAADVALGIPGSRDRDDELTKARAALNWQKHFDLSFDPDLARAYHDEDLEVDTDFCAMCGHDWCSVRISKEIMEFYSGKDEAAQPAKKALASPGVNDAGAEVLKKRGNLSPEEIHKLAHKGKKADCHSDKVQDVKEAKLVQLNTLKAHGVVVNESGL